jgi:NADP-dependent 3-hydroxy acid dehydrogenase YdfG
MTNLSISIVLVTGASAGIGEGIAEQFAASGARLILVARRKDRINQLARRLPTDCLPVQLDVRNRTEVNRAVAELPREWKDIDILVKNAGLSRGLDRLHEGNPDGWDEMIDTNIKGLLYVSRAVIPGMVARKRGHIINIGSIAGHEVYPAGNVYCATKHAVDAITRGMLIDLVDTPIRVTTLDPGLVQTEFSEVRFYGDTSRAQSVYQGYQPLTGRDIGDAAVWAATRPDHVNIAQMVVLPTAQRSTRDVRKNP